MIQNVDNEAENKPFGSDIKFTPIQETQWDYGLLDILPKLCEIFEQPSTQLIDNFDIKYQGSVAEDAALKHVNSKNPQVSKPVFK